MAIHSLIGDTNMRKQRQSCAIISLCIASIATQVLALNQIQDSPMRSAILIHHALFVKTWDNDKTSDGERARAFLNNVADQPMEHDDWLGMLTIAVNTSMTGGISANEVGTGYINDEEVMDVLVSALACDDFKTRSYAKESLISRVGNSLRLKYSDRIKETLGPDAICNPSFFMLLAKCDLSEEEKQSILDHPGLEHPVIRALCGDREAEKAMINRFVAEKDYKEKQKLTRQLALVGTPDCAAALTAELDSPVELHFRNWHYSIRYDIITGLGKIHEYEPLFIENKFLLESWQDGISDRRIDLKQYIHDVDQFIQNHYGHPAWADPDKVWFRAVEAMPIFYE